MSFQTVIRVGALALGLAMVGGAAKADRGFVLEDVVLSDGSTVSGSFQFNVLGFFDTWDITSTNGAFPGFHYVLGTPGGATNNNPTDDHLVFNRTAFNGYLNLVFQNGLLSGGGIGHTDSLLLGGASYECSTFGQADGSCTAPLRTVVSGDVKEVAVDTINQGGGGGTGSTPVPEPMSAALLLAGVALAGALRRRA